MASGPLTLFVEGVESNSQRAVLCSEPVSPFVADAQPPFTVDPLLGGIAETGLSNLYPATAGFAPAGQPIIFKGRSDVILAREWDPNTKTWRDRRIYLTREGDPTCSGCSFLPGVAAARDPFGDASILYEVDEPQRVRVGIARRETAASPNDTGAGHEPSIPCGFLSPCAPNPPVWNTSTVLAIPRGVGNEPRNPSALAMSYSADGRIGAVYPAPSLIGGATQLYASIERARHSGAFDTIVVDSNAVDVGVASAAFDESGRLWVAFGRVTTSHPVEQFVSARIEDDLRIHVVRVETDRSVTVMPSPGTGLWPSIAIEFGTLPRVAFQGVRVVESPLAQPEDYCGFVISVDALSPRYAQFDGTSWHGAPIESRAPQRIQRQTFDSFLCSSPPRVSFGNLNLLLPKSVLGIGADGPRFAYVRREGELVVARHTSTGWSSGIAVLGQELGDTLALALDGAGRARIAFEDTLGVSNSVMQLRLYREDDVRGVEPQSELPGCNFDAFQRTILGAEDSFGHFLTANNKFPFSVEWLADLPDLTRPNPDYDPSSADFEKRIPWENIPLEEQDEATREMFRKVLVTAIAGNGSLSEYKMASITEGFGCDSYDFPCSRTDFGIDLDFPRGSPEMELDSLAGGVLHLDLGSAVVPGEVTLDFSIAGNPNHLRYHYPLLLNAFSDPAVPWKFRCFSPEGDNLCPTGIGCEDACGIDSDPGLFASLNSSSSARDLIVLAISLSGLPSTFNISTNDVSIDALGISLAGLSERTRAASASAGGLEFTAGVRNLAAIASVHQSSDLGSITCDAALAADSGRIGTGGLLMTAPSESSMLAGDLQITAPYPVFEFPGAATFVSGAAACTLAQTIEDVRGLLADVVSWNAIFEFDSSAVPLSDTDLIATFEPLIAQKALEDHEALAGGEPWAAYVRQDGTIHLTSPR